MCKWSEDHTQHIAINGSMCHSGEVSLGHVLERCLLLCFIQRSEVGFCFVLLHPVLTKVTGGHFCLLLLKCNLSYLSGKHLANMYQKP